MPPKEEDVVTQLFTRLDEQLQNNQHKKAFKTCDESMCRCQAADLLQLLSVWLIFLAPCSPAAQSW